jgi:aldose 1-epimerase
MTFERWVDATPLVIADNDARVEIYPSHGGAVGRYDVRVDGRELEIFRTDGTRRGVFGLGSNVLAPFSNRISGGGFWHEGRFHPLSPNIPGNPLPTHGNAFTESWAVVDARTDRVVLSLASNGPGPFQYDAELAYSLEEGALSMDLRVRNTARMSLPFGAGFHPWFVRSRSTRLTMSCGGHWSEDDAHLPLAFHPTGSIPLLDFSRGRELPDFALNNAFTGWDGRARIDWPDRGFGVTLRAEPPLGTAIVYSPSAAADFFCFEPVNHSVDAHNRTSAGTAPPQILQPGEILTALCVISPDSGRLTLI